MDGSSAKIDSGPTQPVKESARPNRDIQNRITAATYAQTQRAYLVARDIVRDGVGQRDDDREAYLTAVREGAIGREQHGNFLRLVQPNFPQQVLKQPLTHDRVAEFSPLLNQIKTAPNSLQMLDIIATYDGTHHFGQRDLVGPGDLINFLQKHTNALDFEEMPQWGKLLDMIGEKKGHATAGEYMEAFHALEKVLYGDQVIYVEQMRLLDREARMPKLTPLRSEKPPGIPVPEEEDDNTKLPPLELEGFERFIMLESVGGNASENRAAGNAVYIDGTFHFTNYPSDWSNLENKVTFVTLFPDFSKRKKAWDASAVVPPSLIERIVTTNDQLKELSEKRAIQHNAFLIAKYIQAGGNLDDLPKTPYMPDIDALKVRIELEKYNTGEVKNS